MLSSTIHEKLIEIRNTHNFDCWIHTNNLKKFSLHLFLLYLNIFFN